jgi:hypothetical protein
MMMLIQYMPKNVDISIFSNEGHVGRRDCLLDIILIKFDQWFHRRFDIVAVSFIGGGNRRTQRKPQTCRKSLTNLSHNVVHLGLVEIRTHNKSICEENFNCIV